MPTRRTGRGADFILIDDPLKPEDALSKALRQACNEWFVHTLYSRLNDKRSGAIVIIMQRLHEDDLVGHVLGQEAWEVVSFPAIAEVDEVHAIETIWEPRCFSRRPGEALHPAREPLFVLENIRRTWAAAWSRGNGSSATTTRNGRRASTASCRAGIPPTKPLSSAILACARPGA